ncbi:hypothetical protein NDU88_001740 [Pleurodeles waltl]|uniref:Uncharacterized protein n=1 Tax=Pleurodeles waltl TaxID=8319 RepID=A0AAV7RC37_PLEWA|nr:hypothetical protein NDU88_001740 [Pleurodeles waltl]
MICCEAFSQVALDITPTYSIVFPIESKASTAETKLGLAKGVSQDTGPLCSFFDIDTAHWFGGYDMLRSPFSYTPPDMLRSPFSYTPPDMLRSPFSYTPPGWFHFCMNDRDRMFHNDLLRKHSREPGFL